MKSRQNRGIYNSSEPKHRKGRYVVLSATLVLALFSVATIGQQQAQAQQQNEVNWEQLCIQYGGLVGIHTPCSELAQGTILTEKGKTALGCLFGGGVLLLLGVDPATVAAIGKGAKAVCP